MTNQKNHCISFYIHLEFECNISGLTGSNIEGSSEVIGVFEFILGNFGMQGQEHNVFFFPIHITFTNILLK